MSSPFTVRSYRLISDRVRGVSTVQAVVDVTIGVERVRRSAVGVGPLHALDSALRACLETHFPVVDEIRLSDYSVDVVDPRRGTAADVRVAVEATDGERSWMGSCVAGNVVDASFDALCDAMTAGIVGDPLYVAAAARWP